MKISFPFLLIIFSLNIYAQDSQEWFPKELNIQPFTANILEGRTGFNYMMGESSLRLDVGTSTDVYQSLETNKTFSFGADFFTYTRLHGSGEFHFPVETIDYLFGVNGGYKVRGDNNEYGVRLRISHISAHLVDGSYDYRIDDWRNYQRPRVYSREFIELLPYFGSKGFRVYAGFTYLIHNTPEVFGKMIYQGGFDYYLTSLSDWISPFAAYDFRLSKIDKYAGTNAIAAGVKFGSFNKKGFSILYTYFAGRSIHGEYYDFMEHYSTIGFNLDL